ncbi:MAG: hypothetical protein ACJAVJ_002043 [Planctomycetota bacterium]|jgi:uncharacterized protein (TIGR00255 family)
MLRSMTGFGSASLERDELSLTCEVRSVNHRHLTVRVKGPHEISAHEIALEKLVKAKLERGSVTVYLRLERSGALAAASVQKDLIRHYAAEFDAIAAEIGREGDKVSLDRILSMPGVIAAESSDGWTDLARKLADQCLSAALEDLVTMREREGAAMAADLRHNANELEARLVQVEGRMPEVVREHGESLQRRVNDLIEGSGHSEAIVDAGILAREIALIGDKLDVSEETSRLRSHLDQLAHLLDAATADDAAGALGRKLDFLIQEFLREVNTIGSKCNDAEVSHLVVDMKNFTERLREQVQNVE